MAYYFPPMGLSGVQRVAKFVKYLPDFGWQPTVITIEPAGYFAYDTSLLQEVIDAGVTIHRVVSWDPSRLFGNHRTVSMPSEPRRRRLSSLSQFFFVPDNKIGWMPRAVRLGEQLLREASFDAIFSSAPPYTAHLIAARLSRKSGIPLLVDFRDDWVGNPRHVYSTRLHRHVNQRLERRVLGTSQHVLTINEPIRQSIKERNNLEESKISVLPQGFDQEDFQGEPTVLPRKRMRVLYSGIFYDAQTPDFFLRALAQTVVHHPAVQEELEVLFIGLLPEASLQLIQDLGIQDLVRYEGYVAHEKAVALQCSADVLWMTIGKRPGAESISTGKLYEYFGARKPILALIPEGAAHDALRPHGAATVVEPDDVNAIEEALVVLHRQWKTNSLPTPNESYVRQFDRKNLAGQLATHLAHIAVGG